MFCSKCGNPIDENSDIKFCSKCGNDLSNIANKDIEEIKNDDNMISDNGEKIPDNVISENLVSDEVKKKRKRNLWIAIVLTCGIWTIICWSIIIFMVKNYSVNLLDDTNNSKNSTTNIEDSTSHKSDVALSKEESAKKFKEEGKRVGSEDFGYISVPKNWYKFYDVDGNNTLQYSYANVWIATLYAIDADIADSLSYASSVYASLEEDGVEELKVATVPVNDYTTYQVSCYYPNENIWLGCWFIDGEDGKTHYIAVEGPDVSSNYFYDIVLTFDINE